MGEHLNNLRARQQQLEDVLGSQLEQIDCENLMNSKLQFQLDINRQSTRTLVKCFTRTYEKYRTVLEEIQGLERADLLPLEELC